MNPFDIINSITFNKNVVIDKDNSAQYNAYMVNKGLSYFADTVLFANYMNYYYQLPGYIQYDFYMETIPKKRRSSKWHKKINIDNVDVLCEYYKISKDRAVEYLKLLTPDQIEVIKKRLEKGGRSK